MGFPQIKMYLMVVFTILNFNIITAVDFIFIAVGIRVLYLG